MLVTILYVQGCEAEGDPVHPDQLQKAFAIPFNHPPPPQTFQQWSNRHPALAEKISLPESFSFWPPGGTAVNGEACQQGSYHPVQQQLAQYPSVAMMDPGVQAAPNQQHKLLQKSATLMRKATVKPYYLPTQQLGHHAFPTHPQMQQHPAAVAVTSGCEQLLPAPVYVVAAAGPLSQGGVSLVRPQPTIAEDETVPTQPPSMVQQSGNQSLLGWEETDTSESQAESSVNNAQMSFLPHEAGGDAVNPSQQVPEVEAATQSSPTQPQQEQPMQSGVFVAEHSETGWVDDSQQAQYIVEALPSHMAQSCSIHESGGASPPQLPLNDHEE